MKQTSKRPHIYCYTDLKGKVYVGQSNGTYNREDNHRTQSEDVVVIDGTIFGKANKHPEFYASVLRDGWNNIDKTILEDDINLEELNTKERYWINKMDAEGSNGLNGTRGKLKSYRGEKVVFNLETLKTFICKTNQDVEDATGIPKRRVSDMIKNVMPSYRTIKGNIWAICKYDEIDKYNKLISSNLELFKKHAVSQKGAESLTNKLF